jgi:16S rRNA (adenine1518-N6/adenine1519-N6)-dimethyltransferase
VGPGPGNLTRLLAARFRRVIAVEVDKKLYEELSEEFAGRDNVQIIHADALKFDYGSLPEFRVISNIPYHITTPLVFKLLAAPGVRSITLTVQKEVARRMAAAPGPGDYGVLSLMVQYRAEVHYKFTIPRGAFRPVPKVDSACVVLDLLREPRVKVMDEVLFIRLVKSAFSRRRKTMTNGIRQVCTDPKEALTEAGIDGQRRPETLSIEEFARLADVIYKMDKKEGPTR